VPLLFALVVYGFYIQALGGLAAPFLAADFQLDDAAITAIAGWIALGAFGTALATRLADRYGRRRVLVASFAGLPPLALVSALAWGVPSYVVPQIGVNALLGTLVTALAVAVAERSTDAGRASGQAWFGFYASFGGAVALIMGALVPLLPGGWRAFWGLAALPVLAIPLVRARLAETERFTTARDSGRVATTRARDLFRGAYRRRAIGLLAVALLKPVAVAATSTWPYYHMVKTLELSPATASLVYFLGGGIGLVGNPLGARLTDRWGRRPTSLLGTLLAIASGVAFYYVPAETAAISPLPMLVALMAGNQIATSAFTVADRCIDAELFPTALRATYLGAARLMTAGSGVAAMFGLSVLAAPLGSLGNAIAVLSIASLLPALAIFLAVVPETRGLSLEHASLEDETA
jgi:AAHS family 3-hydroxyphenylpropionic acid transporter